MSTIEKLTVATAALSSLDPTSASWPNETTEIGVDQEAGIVRGYVVALAGDFKSEGRGRFSEESLRELKRIWPTGGIVSHSQHANILDDGLLNFLGRAKAPRLSKAISTGSDGKRQLVPAVRADLHFDPVASKTPHGDLQTYFLDRVESDPSSLSSSLVLTAKQDYETDRNGRPLRDASGNEIPPLWIPSEVLGSDLVARGDAVDGVLGLGPDPRTGRIVLRQDQRAAEAEAAKYDPARDAHKLAIRRRMGEMEKSIRKHRQAEAERPKRRTVRGLAAPFGRPFQLKDNKGLRQFGYQAFDRFLRQKPLVGATMNHDLDHFLATSADGSIRFSQDAKGLWCEIDLPATRLGASAAAQVATRPMGMSLTFPEEGSTRLTQSYSQQHRAMVDVRELSRVSPIEVCLTDHPACKETLGTVKIT